ncbi:hypothetical protein [Meiothermus cerbereus]|uniref:hypothetical protein n=1 Tax=Meiothermus cerbereus TaxID=65552 RepID=UPI003EEB5675
MPNKYHHVGRVRPPKERRLAALGVEALRPDEVSVRVRVRLRKPLAALFDTLPPKRRGEAVEAGLRALGLLEEVQDGKEASR